MNKKPLFLRINAYIQWGLFAIIAVIFIIRYIFDYVINSSFFAIVCSLVIVNVLFRLAYNCRPKLEDYDENEPDDKAEK